MTFAPSRRTVDWPGLYLRLG